MTRPLAASIVLLLTMTFTSCMCGGGGDTVIQNKETCGKRFSDLKGSLDSGAINQAEYDKIRARILKECK